MLRQITREGGGGLVNGDAAPFGPGRVENFEVADFLFARVVLQIQSRGRHIHRPFHPLSIPPQPTSPHKPNSLRRSGSRSPRPRCQKPPSEPRAQGTRGRYISGTSPCRGQLWDCLERVDIRSTSG